MNKKLGIIFGCIVALFIFFFGFQAYSKFYDYSMEHFLNRTSINGVDCSDLTISEAKTKLTNKWNEKTFTIKSAGKTVGEISNLDFTYNIDSALESKMKLSPIALAWEYLSNGQTRIEIEMKPAAITDNFNNQLKGLTFLDTDYTVKTADAYVDLSSGNFDIVPEVQGDNMNREKFQSDVIKKISDGVFTMTYKAEDYYTKPAVKKDDAELIEYQSFCKKYLTQKIIYQFADGKYTLTAEDLNSMLSQKDDGTAEVNEKNVAAFISKMADKHNTLGTKKKFTTTGGSTIYISARNDGYVINETKETQELVSVLESGKDVSRKPEYSKVPSESGIGNTYIEVSIGAQHLWLYKNGTQVLSTDIVTGNRSAGHSTPTGVYHMAGRSRNVTLRGYNGDGTKYASKVSYWMPFNGDIGFHDATWRNGKFGGSIYINGGSHGCVNMPPDSAAILYNNTWNGYTVVVY